MTTLTQCGNSGTECSIYVACLAAYNSGWLHGEWIDATQDPDEIRADIRKMLASSPEEGAEEWAIHDHEGFPSTAISEYSGIDEVCELAAFIVEHGEIGCEVLGHFSGNIENAEEALTECYHGEFDSEVDFAVDLFEQCYSDMSGVPEICKTYFDYEAFARDLFIDGYYSIEVDHKVHVFSHC